MYPSLLISLSSHFHPLPLQLPSSGLLVTRWLLCVMEVLQLWVSRTGSFTCPNHLKIEILGWASSESWIRAWEVAEPVSPLALPYSFHQGKLSIQL